MSDTILNFTEITGEKSRRYTFPKGHVTIENVVKLCVRPSGNHRLETSNGKKYIVAAGWLSIEIDAEGGWSA